MQRQFEISAGERTIVIDRRSGSIPRDYLLEITSVTGGQVGGTVEIQGSRWLWRKDPVVEPIAREVRAHKGFWDTLFRVTVTPNQDAIVTVR